jgi:hypothetical protein
MGQCSAVGGGGLAGAGGQGPRPRPVLAGISALLLVLGAVILQRLGGLEDASGLRGFWTGASLMGAGYAISWRAAVVSPALFWGVAIGTRLILIGMEPGVDIWRYLWEGLIQLQGFSPFHLSPDAPVLESLRTAWWDRVGFRDTTAIYPPLSQLLFRSLAAISPSVVLFKASFLLADLGVCWLLCRAFGEERACLYAWNPLVIYSFSGGGHVDSWFLLAVVSAWLIEEGCIGCPWGRPWRWSALLLGISVALKWVSLPLLVFLILQALGQRLPLRALQIALLGTLPLLLTALPFCGLGSCPLVPLDSQFVSHGRTADLIPHLLARIWPSTLDSNAIPMALLAVVVLLLLGRARSMNRFIQLYWPILLLMSPIVHAWYLTWWIPFGVPGRNWGTRLIGLSGFAYFPLPATPPDWAISDPQRLLLWLPALFGAMASGWSAHRAERAERQRGRSDRA